MSRRCFLIGTMLTLTFGQPCAAEDYLTGASLYADVARFASFGSHRFGSPGDRATTDWIAGELQAAGFRVEFQPVVLGRQYVVDRASAEVDGTKVEATPFWWPPEEKASFHLAAPLAREGDVVGKIVWVELPNDRGAYLGPAHREAIAHSGGTRSRGNPAGDRQSRRRPLRLQRHAGGQALAGARDGGCRKGQGRVRRRDLDRRACHFRRRRPL